ncbi:MAG TPA: hypothetical protein VIR27_22050 [Mycobacteriales bacterium]|jgi:hypothetical protein
MATAASSAAAEGPISRETVRARARATGRLVVPDQPSRVPSHDEIPEIGRLLGRAVSQALAAERKRR